jgi:hypothetical protein
VFPLSGEALKRCTPLDGTDQARNRGRMAETTLVAEFLSAIESHDVEALRIVLDRGFDPRATVNARTPVQWLLEMYMRSSRFPSCLRLLLERGGELGDPALLPVLLDDAERLRAALRKNPALQKHRADLVSAFTPLRGASLLHVAAEYGCAAAAAVLLEAGADVEARAATDEHGGDGHTPLFHTVCSLLDHAAPILRLLLAAGARTDVRLSRLTWGRGFEWETTFYDVTPVSYCQAGLMPQMHRREADVYRNLGHLFAAAGRPAPSLANVPNRYLRPRT